MLDKTKLQKTLQVEKPKVFAKRNHYVEAIQKGEYALQLIELNYDNRCNFDCDHCFSRTFSSGARKLTVDDVKRLADSAHELGVWQFNLQGGEPLTWSDLPEVVKAIDPSRFHIMITTNGYLLTPEKARELKQLGVDKVAISIDSFDEKKHDNNRNRPGSHKRALAGLAYTKEAGLHANINYVVTRESVRSQETLDMISYAEENGYSLLCIVATSSGNWAGREDLLITEEDAEYLKELHEKHPVLNRDLYESHGIDYGCRTLNGLVYITESGDLLSCPFIHIAIGNILEEPLKEILARGWKVKHFRNHSSKCLAGEDRNFIRNYMPAKGSPKPILSFEEAFGESDFVND